MSEQELRDGKQIDGLDDIEMVNTSVDDIQSDSIDLVFTGTDESASMRIHQQAMVNALSDFKQGLCDSKEADQILVARGNFNDHIDIGGYKKITQYDVSYQANGMTALYNVIIEGADKLIVYMNHLRKEGVRVKAVFAIFSDGDDTVARNLHSDARKKIAELNAAEVTTAFISFGSEANDIAKDLGFVNILDIDKSTDPTSELRKAFNCLSKSVIENSKSVISGANKDFFDI